MNKTQLLTSARELKQPSEKAALEYFAQKEILSVELTRVLSERNDTLSLIGKENMAMMTDNHNNHTRFMAGMFIRYNPETLVETVLWVFRAYRSHGFSLTYWPAMLNTLMSIMEEKLSTESFNQLSPFYNWMIVNQATFVKLSDDSLSTGPGS